MEELQGIVSRFQEKEVEGYGTLSEAEKRLISVSVLTALGRRRLLREEVKKALQAGNAPEAVSEAVIQCTPYAGYPAAQEALPEVFQAFAENSVSLPLPSGATTGEEDRFRRGLEVQYAIFGKDTIDQNRRKAKPEVVHIQDYLSGYCFGDFYTRDGLDLKMRELLTFCILAAMGCCEPQLTAHVQGNLQIGNDRMTLLSAATWCLPYIGFPKTLNAIRLIEAVTESPV